MPRIIGCEKNELILQDNLSGCQVGLYYRMPTTKERQGYLNSTVRRQKNKVTMHHAESRAKYGGMILVGVRDGDFMRMQDGQPVPMSSDPKSPDYYPQWKEVMEADCGDLVSHLAGVVFDGSTSLPDTDDQEDENTVEDIEGE